MWKCGTSTTKRSESRIADDKKRTMSAIDVIIDVVAVDDADESTAIAFLSEEAVVVVVVVGIDSGGGNVNTAERAH